MSVFEPPRQTSYFLLIFLLVVTIFAWAALTFLRPIIIERGCEEIAVKSNDLRRFDADENSTLYRLDNIKARCIQDALLSY